MANRQTNVPTPAERIATKTNRQLILCALITAAASVVGTYLTVHKPQYEPPKIPVSPVPMTTLNGWKYKNFDGGDLAAQELSLAGEQPLPKDVYATAPAAKAILVWWKPSPGSGFKYRYASIGWDDHNPANIRLPTPEANQVPIGLGGRDYDLFLFFEGSKD